VPTRPTDGAHLRDGWTRAVVARTAQLPEAEQAAVAGALDELRAIFVRGSVPKGKDLVLVRRGSDKALVLEYDVRLPTIEGHAAGS
jgi:hypothetical protein